MTTAEDNNVIDPNPVNCPECFEKGKKVTLFNDGACPECNYLDEEMNNEFMEEIEKMEEIERDKWEDDEDEEENKETKD